MIGGKYDAKESMPITYIFLIGGAIASVVKNHNKFVTDTKILAVDYDLMIVTLPMLASGSLIGVLS